MKKYLVLVLSMLFVLGIAGSAFAIHASIPAETTPVVAPKDTEIRLGGELRIRGWYSDNITDTAGAKATTGRPYDGGSMAWYDQRVRLAVDVRTAPNVTGRIHLETSGENITWGSANTLVPGGGTYAGGGVDLDVLEAWIAYTGSGLLGVPTGLKLGRMPVVVGEGTFFDHRRRGDDAILFYVEPAKGTEINLLTAKLHENFATDNTDDIDLYSLMLTHKLDKDNTLGLNYSLINSNDLLGFNLSDVKLQNVGLFGKGKIAGIGYKATVDFQFGRLDPIPAGLDDQRFRGWAATLGANYKLDPVTLRANFVYGSGDDDDDNRIEAFQTFVGNVIDPNLPTVVYNWRVVTAAGGLGTGIANTTAYNIGITASPIKDLTAHLDYYLLRASKELNPTGFGSDKKIGSELDLRLSYRIARNLTYSINSGILFAGDFYETGVAGVTNDAKNAVVLQHQLVLSF